METIVYNEDSHFQHLCRWLYLRDSYIPFKREMPEVGAVAVKGKEIVAMGFIRRVEGGYGQLDGLASNPESSPEDRDEAIDAVVDQLLNKSKEMGLSSLLAYTRDEYTLLRSARHGFKQLHSHTLIVVDLLPAKKEVI